MDVNRNLVPFSQRPITLTDLCSRVRRFMRDAPYLNRLIKGVESSDEDIFLAMDLCFSDFDNTPPFIGRSDFQNPPPFHILIKGIVIQLLESKGLLESRNSLSFNDGGISIAADKDQRTQNWLSLFTNQYETNKTKFKIAKNIEMAWGVSLSSEYTLINNSGLYTGIY